MKKKFLRMIRSARNDPKARDKAVNFVLFMAIPLIGLVDGLGDGQIRVTVFFLIPIMLITWRMGRRSGYVAATSAFLILIAVSLFDKPYNANSWIFAVDAIGRFFAFFVIVEILSNQHQSYLRQKTIATRDPLTNLHNRLGLQEIMEAELELFRRSPRPFSVIFLDCDNFKMINDRFGHQVGDQALQAIARTLVSSVRRSDVVSRLGGDEFVVYATQIGEKETRCLIQKIKMNLDACMRIRQWPVTFSIGASIFESAPDTVGEMINHADSLMYETKRAGKNGLRISKWPLADDIE